MADVAATNRDVCLSEAELAQPSRRMVLSLLTALIPRASNLPAHLLCATGLAGACERASSQTISEAERVLREDQQRSPPRYAHPNGVAGLVPRLAWRRPMERAFREGRFVIGEIGDLQPNALTKPWGRGRPYYVIEMSSGLLDFTYAFVIAMGGRSVVLNRDGTQQNAPAATQLEAVSKAADVLKHWQRFSNRNLWDSIWGIEGVKRDIFSLPPTLLTYEEQIVVYANLFVLCHELGHVALNLGLVETDGPVNYSEELKADLVGLMIFWESIQRDADVRLALAGYAVSVRLRESLAQLGVKFSDQYGDVRGRLELGLAQLRQLSPTVRYFDEASTVLVARLRQMDEIDLTVTGISRSWTDDEWSRWSGLVSSIGGLLSVVNNKIPKNDWLGHVQREFSRLNPGGAQFVARTLRLYYVDQPQLPGLIEPNVRRQMGLAMLAMIPDLPSSTQMFFNPI